MRLSFSVNLDTNQSKKSLFRYTLNVRYKRDAEQSVNETSEYTENNDITKGKIQTLYLYQNDNYLVLNPVH